MGRLLFFLTLAVVGVKWSNTEEGVLRDYCEADVFHANCPPGKVILMEEALYGRMGLGSCLKLDLGYMNCSRNVIWILDEMCSGKSSCQVGVFALVQELNPCPQELRSYLQARYMCLQVLHPDEYCCQISSKSIDVDAKGGYLTSRISEDAWCGNTECPILLTVSKGMHINISLYDFHHLSDERANASGALFKSCLIYAILNENAVGASKTICASEERFVYVYTSIGNSVEINFVQKTQGTTEPPRFLFSYEAFGCPDPDPTRFGFVERIGYSATVGCHDSSSDSWEIECINGVWKGHIGNCSITEKIVAPKVGEVRFNTPALQIEPGIIIALIVIITLIISATVITVGVAFIKRYRHNEETIYLTHLGQCSNMNNDVLPKISSHGNSTGASYHGLLREAQTPWQSTRPLPTPRRSFDYNYKHVGDISATMQQGGASGTQNEVKYYTLDPGLYSNKYRDTEDD